MRCSSLRLFGASAIAYLFLGAAQATPVANLPLTCSSESSIGQSQNDCTGVWSYQTPNAQLIVLQGPAGIWMRAADLASNETLAVCLLPVEPGTYSSCRDGSGVRRTAFVPKGSVIGGNSVTVSKAGGDYTDPVTAAANAFAGDTWCVAPTVAQPCLMAIGQGVFILPQTLSIPAGLIVAGAGKGDTMLVADTGVETAVSGDIARISDLTIVNSQPGRARTTGLSMAGGPGGLTQLHDVAIHVAGAAQNVAVVAGAEPVTFSNPPLEMLDSEITAMGQDSFGILAVGDFSVDYTLERSVVSAGTALQDHSISPGGGNLRLVDSKIFGEVSFSPEDSLVEIIRSGIVGNVAVGNDATEIVITDSTIQGNVTPHSSSRSVSITDTTVEGNLSDAHSSIFDGLTVQGTVILGGPTTVRRSYINSTSTAPALSLRDLGAGDVPNVLLEQTFVQGAQAIAAATGKLSVSSSVLAGGVSGPVGALTCTDTYGADYELLSATCQPQAP
jgi:hypothetical protein